MNTKSLWRRWICAREEDLSEKRQKFLDSSTPQEQAHRLGPDLYERYRSIEGG